MNIRFSCLMPGFPLGNFNFTNTSETVQENINILQNSFSKAGVTYFPFEHEHVDEDRNPNIIIIDIIIVEITYKLP